MIIEYDKSPGITDEKRLQSLMESVQLAMDEIEIKLKDMKKQMDRIESDLSSLLNQ